MEFFFAGYVISNIIIEFVLPEKGLYTFLDHPLADAEIGAAGTIKAE